MKALLVTTTPDMGTVWSYGPKFVFQSSNRIVSRRIPGLLEVWVRNTSWLEYGRTRH